MKSMTGYGKFTAVNGGREVSVELKSVNNRYLEINCRIPKLFSRAEDVIRRTLKGLLQRGSVDVFFTYVNTDESARRIRVNLPLAKEYASAAQALQSGLGLSGEYAVADLMRNPDVLCFEDAEEDLDTLDRLSAEAAAGAAARLNEMREAEGKTIADDLLRSAAVIEQCTAEVETLAPKSIAQYRQRLDERIRELLNSVDIDEARLLNETAFMADKLDINEELSRLRSHLKQFADLVQSVEEPKGRKLDFLAQELNREINTTGSKCNDTAITEAVLRMKNELEKIKEQIRNVE